MFLSLQPVSSSSARFCTIQDRSDVWPVATSSDTALPDFGALAEGLMTGTLVATERGWRAVETLRPSESVLTFDNGMRKLASCASAPINRDPRSGNAAWGLMVPTGALGNRSAMTLLPSQLVLLGCDYAQRHFGTPCVLVPAALLEGFKGIARCGLGVAPRSYMLAFADAEVVHANGSALVACHATSKTATPNYPCVTWAKATAFRASLFGRKTQLDTASAAIVPFLSTLVRPA
ncbi:MAG: Hint domain-containing protein [Rhodobacteraceae bacterium]|nr:Hint domain-containing protein [Paracoccaceae bacterium]